MEALTVLASMAVAAAVIFTIAATRRTGVPLTASDRRLVEMAAGGRQSQSSAPDVRLNRTASTIPFLRSFLNRRGRAERSATALERAGVRMTPGQFLLVRCTLAAIAFFLVGVIVGWSFWGIVLGILGGLAGFALPGMFLSWRTAQRASRMETQLVDMLALVASALRSGFSLLQALDSAAKRVGPPLSEEISKVLTDMRFGRPIEDALEDWMDRVQSRDLRLVVTAISVQRHSGGNLSEILENLAQTMRERSEVRLQINMLTAYPRFTAKIIAAYPLAIVLLLTLMRTEIWGVLWTETVGYAMMGVAFVFNAIAFAIMRAMTKIDY